MYQRKCIKSLVVTGILLMNSSGYLMTNNNYLPKNVIAKKVITFDEFIKCY